MPLPPALLARLAKRGLVEKKQKEKEAAAAAAEAANENEEVFAEDYDDPSKEEPEEQTPVVPAPDIPIQIQEAQTNNNTTTEPIFRETPACPFRSNPYHTCVPYCRRNHGMLEWKPDSTMLKKRERMLVKYPLPEGWVEVGDPVTNRYYYWNLLTDQVSWLSPSHPKADVNQSAEQLGLIGKVGHLDSEGEEAMETLESDPEDDDSQKSGSDTSLSDEEEEEVVKPPSKTESRLFREPPPEPPTPKQESRKGRGKADDLDPMDPASYSDISRGGWNDGLDLRGKAKTGVDETASGPLFQQRPYPSPGDILRANQSIKKKK